MITISCRALALAAFVLFPLLVSCVDSSDDDDDGLPPTATAIPGSGSTIAATDTIDVVFDKTMSRSSLVLDGSMARRSDGGVWSTTGSTDDTVSISPIDAWTANAGETLTVDANDRSGNALDTLFLTYNIPISLSTFQFASVVIGQQDFTSGDPNQGATTNANTLSLPVGAPAEGSLYLADPGNHRVLGYANMPDANNANADFVVGKDTMFQNAPGTSATAMTDPLRVEIENDQLFVLDSGNHRVMIWTSLPLSNVPADQVIGQPNFLLGTPGISRTALDSPQGISVASDMVLVADTGNHRVMIWTQIPTADGDPADLVLGQQDFTSKTAGLSAGQLDTPSDVWTDGQRIAVADTGNNRVLVWNSFPVQNGVDADHVVGQPDFTTKSAALGADGLNAPGGVGSNRLALFVADTGNNRVLIFDTFPTTDQPAADVVLGQPDFMRGFAGTSARTFAGPTDTRVIGLQLAVADQRNSRVLLFDGQ